MERKDTINKWKVQMKNNFWFTDHYNKQIDIKLIAITTRVW